MSAESTLEEAGRCPKCSTAGKLTEKKPGPRGSSRGSSLLIFMCMNDRCRWFNTPWTVTVNADGTIPPPTMNREKFFTPNPAGDYAARMIENLAKQVEQETKPGAEIRRRG